MFKWMYERMVEGYSKESKEELVQRIMATDELEYEDRCFANQCMSGTSMCDINNLFEMIGELKNCLANPESTEEELKECANNLWLATESAEGSWNYIRNGIAEINDNTRSGKKLEDFKQRVARAKDRNDTI